MDEDNCYYLYASNFRSNSVYLLDKLYNFNKDMFYKYISSRGFENTLKDNYDFFTNIKGLNQVYIRNNEKESAIRLFYELIDFARLLIM